MDFGKFSLPPSSNWFYPHLLDVSVDGVIAYGSKSSIVVLESVKKNGKHYKRVGWRKKAVNLKRVGLLLVEFQKIVSNKQVGWKIC